MPKLKLITFDLDDTLWDIEPTIIAAEKKTLDFLITKIPNATKWYNREIMEPIRNNLLKHKPELQHDLGKLRLKSLEMAMIDQGINSTIAKQTAAQAYEVFFNARQKVQFFDDVHPTLARLQKHFMLGVITNGNADVHCIGIGEYFSVVVTSRDAGVSKPDPRIFQHALDSAGVHADEALHVGDHPDNDVRGANDVGMSTLYYRELPRDSLMPHGLQPTLTACNMRFMETSIMEFAASRSAKN